MATRLVRAFLVSLVVGACAKPPDVTSHRPPPRAELDLSGLESIAEFDGNVYAREVGLRDGQPLVLIHGMGERASDDFAPILPALRQHFRVLLMDLPGFGRSARRAYTPTRYARLVRAVVARHFGERPVFVVGHSMGGAIAIELAGNHPESVARLALLDVAGILHYSDYVHTVVRAPRADDGFFTRARKEVRTTMFEIGLSPFAAAKLERWRIAEGRHDGWVTASTAAALLFIQHDFGPALRRVKAPALLGWGARDDVAPPRTADALRYALKPVADHVFARSAHVPMATEPEEVVRALTAFFAQPLPAEAATTPSDSRRIGRCHRESDRIFEGDYDRIEVVRCKRVLLRNVRTKALRVEEAEVELRGVEVLGGEGLVAIHSDVLWTGGHVVGECCMDVSHSDLNLLAVSCVASEQGVRVRTVAGLIASASEVAEPGRIQSLHGRYDLVGTQKVAPPDRRDERDGPPAQGSRTAFEANERRGQRLAYEQLTGERAVAGDFREADLSHADLSGADLRRADFRNAKLRGADMRGADLRGALLQETDLGEVDLRGADLRGALIEGANFTRAKCDVTTQLPEGFDPQEHGMALFLESVGRSPGS